MANFFSLYDGNLTDTSVYGYSLTGAEVMTGVSGVSLGTVDAYGPVFTGDGSTISAVAVHLSARQANNTTDSLILKLSAAGKSVQTEYYPISNFTSYNGSNNLIASYPLNWQILKLSAGYTIPNLSSAKISLAATTSGVISLIGVSAANNFDKAVIASTATIPTSNDTLHLGGSVKLSATEIRTVVANTSSYQNIYVHNQGILTFPTSANKTLTLNGSAGLQITSDGTLNVGTDSVSIPLSTTHTIILSNTQIDVHNGGNLNVYGYPKLFTTNLISDTISGSKTFTTVDNVSSIWNVGDTLTLRPNLTYRTGFDTLTLSSFTGSNTFTTTSASAFTHTGSATYANIAGVYNLNRNVIIRGLNSTARGTIRTIDAAKTNINYAQLSNFGINNIDKNGLMISNNLSGSTTLNANSFINDATYNSVTFGMNRSLYFNGTANSQLTIPDAVNTGIFSLSTGNWTIEFWKYRLSNVANAGIFTSSCQTSTAWTSFLNAFQIDFDGTPSNLVLGYASNGVGGASSVTLATIAQLPLNTWTHVAVVRNETSVKCFVNGTQVSDNAIPLSQDFRCDGLAGVARNDLRTTYNFNGYISNLRVVKGTAVYTSNFNVPIIELSNITNTSLLINPTSTYVNTISGINYGSAVSYVRFSPYQSNNNISINNNILYKPISSGGFLLQNSTNNNTNINNTYILSSAGIGLQISNSTGTISMSNNTTIGSLSYGTYLYNNSLSGTYGANNFNSALQGMMVSGTNTGTIVGGGLNSPKEGVYVDTSTYNLSATTFQNILANNNSSVGFKVSGNNLNYLTPITLNINGLSSNTNSDAGVEAYNIVGNISSVVANSNIGNGIKTSIGNGNTVFDGLTSIPKNYSILSGSYTPTGTQTISANTPYVGLDALKYLTTTNNISISSPPTIGTSDFTIELWAYIIDQGSGFVIGQGSNVINGWYVTKTGVGFYDGSTRATATYPIALSDRVWYHIAAVRRNNSINAFINGVSATAVSCSFNLNNTSIIQLGNNPSSIAEKTDGYISNFRITKSALYTTNFTPPSSSKLLEIPNTILLLNNYNNTYTYTDATSYNSIGMNILSAYNYNQTVIKNALLSATTTTPSVTGIGLNASINKLEDFRLENSTLSATIPLSLTSTRSLLEGCYTFHKCNSDIYGLSSLALTGYQSDVFTETGFSVMNENNLSAGKYRMLAAGKISYDASIVHGTDTVSEKLEPWSSTKLRSSSKLIPINIGETITITVWIYKSSAYNGANPRLILKGNASLGYTDTVLYTFTDNTATWLQATISIPSASLGTGYVEFYVDCSGYAGCGSINISDWDFS